MAYPQFPLKLYGRDVETHRLLSSFSYVREEGTPRILIVAGTSGVGKSTIVYSVLKKFETEGTQYIVGKGNQFQHNVPYFVIRSAFRDLIQRFKNNEVQRHQWCEKLLAVLGSNSQIITDIIPELKSIIGPQTTSPELDPIRSKNRFKLVFQNFIRAFCSQEHPLVVFLDDLQWVDLTTLKLIEIMMTDREANHLFLIGAYRDNEVGTTHPLTITLEKLRNEGINFQRIHLMPLSNQQVTQLMADTLQDWVGQSRYLLDPTGYQINGNPLYVKQLLISLYIENQHIQDKTSKLWHWQLEQLPQHDLVGLIAQSLAKLSLKTQHLLKRATCIGNQVPLQLLADISETSTTQILEQLKDALEIQLIAVEDSNKTIFFIHDRIRQAIYGLIPSAVRKGMHFSTGKLLLQNNNEEFFFATVNQLNLGRSLITNQTQKNELTALNLRAARQAKTAIAFEIALNYIHQSLEISGNAWGYSYSFTLAVYKEAIEIEYLNHNFEQAHSLSNIALKRTRTLLDRVKIYQLKIKIYIAQNLFGEAIDLGLKVLGSLGVTLDQELSERFEVENLINLPTITDYHKLAALEILTDLSDMATVARPELVPSMVVTEVNLCVAYGNSPLSTYAYIDYAFLLCNSGEIDLGHQYKQLALRLLRQFNANNFSTKVITISNINIRPWKEHLKETQISLLEAVKLGIETGNLEFSGYAAINYCTHAFLLGLPLKEVEQTYIEYTNLLTKLNLQFHISGNAILHQTVLNLLGSSPEAIQLNGAIFSESEMIPDFHFNHNLACLFFTYLAKGILSYLLGDYVRSIESLREAEKYKSTFKGFIAFSIHDFYYSLAHLAHYPSTSKSEQSEILRQVNPRIEQLKKWATHAPMNFQHKHELIAALSEWIANNINHAKQLFEKAIKGARKNGYIQEEALANELAGKFYLNLGEQETAKRYLTEAHKGFLKWGALAVIRRLERDYDCLRSFDISFDFARTMCNLFVDNLQTQLLRVLELAEASIEYDSATQSIVIVAENNTIAAMVFPCLPFLEQQSPAGAEITLRIKDTS